MGFRVLEVLGFWGFRSLGVLGVLEVLGFRVQAAGLEVRF